jgi:Trk K+ transport system NAD-binding subunit
MGAVQCQFHGHQLGGPLGCKHLARDLSSQVAVRPYRQLRSDFLDDGSVVLDVAFCAQCLSTLGLDKADTVSAATLGSENMVPLCPQCWRERKGKRELAHSVV